MKITQKQKRVIIWTLVIIALLLFLVQCMNDPTSPTDSGLNLGGGLFSVFSGGGGGGGGSGTTTTTTESTGTSWFSFFTARTPPECSRDTDCNKCANAAYDVCIDNKCGCVAPDQPIEETRSFFTTTRSECSRDSECNKCANPDYDTCVAGACECVAPTPVTTESCSDTDSVAVRSGIAYDIAGSCNDSSGTIIANDFCSGTMLVEYYCGTVPSCVSTTVSCSDLYGRASFCSDGACVQPLA